MGLMPFKNKLSVLEVNGKEKNKASAYENSLRVIWSPDLSWRYLRLEFCPGTISWTQVLSFEYLESKFLPGYTLDSRFYLEAIKDPWGHLRSRLYQGKLGAQFFPTVFWIQVLTWGI